MSNLLHNLYLNRLFHLWKFDKRLMKNIIQFLTFLFRFPHKFMVNLFRKNQPADRAHCLCSGSLIAKTSKLLGPASEQEAPIQEREICSWGDLNLFWTLCETVGARGVTCYVILKFQKKNTIYWFWKKIWARLGQLLTRQSTQRGKWTVGTLSAINTAEFERV